MVSCPEGWPGLKTKFPASLHPVASSSPNTDQYVYSLSLSHPRNPQYSLDMNEAERDADVRGGWT